MPSFVDLLVVIGMFALRIGVPVAITVGLVYLLKRLDRRWEAELREQQRLQPAVQPGIQPTAPKPAERPATPKRAPVPAPQLPWVPPPAIKERQPIQPGILAQTARPCWDVKGCSESAKANCAAPKHPEMPCWQARFDAEGQIPEDCVKCDTFQRYPTM